MSSVSKQDATALLDSAKSVAAGFALAWRRRSREGGLRDAVGLFKGLIGELSKASSLTAEDDEDEGEGALAAARNLK